MELPALDKGQTEFDESIHEWDAMIEQNKADGVRVEIVAKHDVKLNAKSGWF